MCSGAPFQAMLDFLRFTFRMPAPASSTDRVQFGVFELDLQRAELRKNGVKVKLQEQPLKVLQVLLENPGQIVSRDELRQRIWPADTFVEFDQGLYSAMARLRDALGDSSESPRFIETVARKGYRFIAPILGQERAAITPTPAGSRRFRKPIVSLVFGLVSGALLLLLILAFDIGGAREWLSKVLSVPPTPHALTRITFDSGLQIGVTWSPDGHLIAYGSNRSGKFDIWAQQIGGGDPVQITHTAGENWQPDWSPDGKYIAYRSEAREGGIYVIPSLGGKGQERKVSSFGYYPRWSPDGSQILFQTSYLPDANRFYVVGLDGSTPREVLNEFLAKQGINARSAAWFPDGKKITVWTWGDVSITPSPNAGKAPVFWTVPLDGITGVRSDLPVEAAKRFSSVSGNAEDFEDDSRFSWSPSHDAIYFERTIRGAKNLWRLSVDPYSLRGSALERLTAGTDLDADFSLSRDGKRLAFTAEAQEKRAWLFPFDALRGRVTGQGKAVTPPGMTVYMHAITRDGTRLAFDVSRAGSPELWEMSLLDGHATPILPDEYFRACPVWAPDGKRIAYMRLKSWAGPYQLFVWSDEDRSEAPITELGPIYRHPFEWSKDGRELLAAETSNDSPIRDIWRQPIDAPAKAAKIISLPGYNLFQSYTSPDEKWIVFEAYRQTPSRPESHVYVVPVDGGNPTQITQEKSIDDKPRWSPDGKDIYFVSDRDGFFNLWRVGFDSQSGRAMGAPARITTFDSPALMVPKNISLVELSLAGDKFVLNLVESSGGIWMLDNVDK